MYVTNNKLFSTQKKEIYDWKKFLGWKGDYVILFTSKHFERNNRLINLNKALDDQIN